MLTKTLAYGVIALCAISAVWWWVDPVGFANNLVLRFFKDLTLRSEGYHR